MLDLISFLHKMDKRLLSFFRFLVPTVAKLCLFIKCNSFITFRRTSIIKAWFIRKCYKNFISFCRERSLRYGKNRNFWKLKSQCPEIDFNKVSNTIHKTYIGLTSMLQGFQKCIA